VLGREVEDDAMILLAQKCFAGCFGGKHAGLAFDAEFAVEAAMLRREAELVERRISRFAARPLRWSISPCNRRSTATPPARRTHRIGNG
jgi:hypothetical protein